MLQNCFFWRFLFRNSNKLMKYSRIWKWELCIPSVSMIHLQVDLKNITLRIEMWQISSGVKIENLNKVDLNNFLHSLFDEVQKILIKICVELKLTLSCCLEKFCFNLEMERKLFLSRYYDACVHEISLLAFLYYSSANLMLINGSNYLETSFSNRIQWRQSCKYEYTSG